MSQRGRSPDSDPSQTENVSTFLGLRGLDRRLIGYKDLMQHVSSALSAGRWNMPTDDGLARLWFTCLFIQSADRASATNAELGQRMIAARRHLDGFLESARLMRESVLSNREDFINLPTSESMLPAKLAADSVLLEQLQRLAELENVVAQITHDPLFSKHEDCGKITTWNDYALLLERAFVDAVSTANAKVLGRGDNGPAVAFVFSIVPAIFGQDPKSKQNVAKQLKARRKPSRLALEVLDKLFPR